MRMNIMKGLPLVAATLALSAAVAGTTAQTATTRPIELHLSHARVTTELRDGKPTERLEDAAAARPGDILEYRVRATNTTDRAMNGLHVDLPIPSHTAYLDASATAQTGTATLLASYDRKTFAAPPLKRKVLRDGKTVEETVRANEYTTLRWVLRAPLAPHQTLEFKARVRMN